MPFEEVDGTYTDCSDPTTNKLNFNCSSPQHTKNLANKIPYCDANNGMAHFQASYAEDGYYAIPVGRKLLCAEDETIVSPTTNYALQFGLNPTTNKYSWYCTQNTSQLEYKHYCIPQNFYDHSLRSDLWGCVKSKDPDIASTYTPYDDKPSCLSACSRNCALDFDDGGVYCSSLSELYEFGVVPDICNSACGFYCKNGLNSNIVQNDPASNPDIKPDSTSCGYYIRGEKGEHLFNLKSHVTGCFPRIEDKRWKQGCTNFVKTADHFKDKGYNENNAGCGMATKIARKDELDILTIPDWGTHHVGILPPGQGCFCEMKDGGFIDDSAYTTNFDGEVACMRDNGWLNKGYTSAVTCGPGSTLHTGKRGDRPYVFCIPNQ